MTLHNTQLPSIRDCTRVLPPKQEGKAPAPTMTEAELGKAMLAQAIIDRRRYEEEMGGQKGSASSQSKAEQIFSRRKMLRDLLTEWKRIVELSDATGIPEATISKDMADLVSEGRVKSRRVGRNVVYLQCTPETQGERLKTNGAKRGPKPSGPTRKTLDRLNHIVAFCHEWRSGTEIKAELKIGKGAWERLRTIAMKEGLLERKGTNTGTRFRATTEGQG